MRRLEELDELIKSINYHQLWRGFSNTKYALYDDKFYYLNDISGTSLKLEKAGSFFRGKSDERFTGNTVISIDDNYIAIWNEKTTPDDTDNRTLASFLVHEMFHCFQLSYGEKRFPNELLNIDYPITVENIELRTQERQYLLFACVESDKSRAREYLDLFYSIRRKREQLIDCNIDYEKAIETVEGTAVYVEYCALKQLLGDDCLALTEYIREFSEIAESNLNIRRSTYHQGLLLCLIADEYIPNWKSNFVKSGLYLSDLIYSLLEINLVDIESKPANSKEIEKCIINWIKQRDNVFDEFDNRLISNIIEDGFKVTGFDPMNIVKRDQEIIHKNFLKIKVEECEQVIRGPVKTIIGDHIFDVKKIVW